MEEIFYDKDLGICGTIPQLVDLANRYTNDYTDEALRKISEIAKDRGFEEKYQKIPLFLIDERKRESEKEEPFLPYERMKIDHYIFGNISASISDGEGGESEIWQEGDTIVISLSGIDDEGYYSAENAVSVKDFMDGDYNYLDRLIGETLFYGKRYEEE